MLGHRKQQQQEAVAIALMKIVAQSDAAAAELRHL